MEQKKYGLPTAITMVMGIVIGSGILFKTDNVLILTGGNVVLGILVFLIAAFSIVFGSITISELALRTDNPGGIVTYAEEFGGTRMAAFFGWFQTFVYYPTINAVVASVIGIYWCNLFGMEATLQLQTLIAVISLILLFAFNTFLARIGGKLQNIATVIKLLPLVFIAVCGILFGNPSALAESSLSSALVKTSWIAALGPIAFSFDGWIISTSIAHETRNAKRNLPIALVVGPIGILASYILFFVGVSMLLGPQTIMEMGDNYLNHAANLLLGDVGARVVMVTLVISVIGTVNGVVIGSIRSPHALALRGLMPASSKIGVWNKRFDTPVASSVAAFGISMIWLALHYIIQKYGLLPNTDIADIAIVISYGLYIPLYYQVFKLYRKKEVTSKAKGIVFPIFALMGSLVMLYSGLKVPRFPLYLVIVLGISALSFVYSTKKRKA